MKFLNYSTVLLQGGGGPQAGRGKRHHGKGRPYMVTVLIKW